MQLQSSSSKLEQPIEILPVEVLQNWLVNQLASQLSLDAKTIKATEPLTRYGLDSIDAVTMVGDLEDWLALELPSTLFWDHPTIEKSTQYLAENFDIAEALKNLETNTNEGEVAKTSKTEATANEEGGWGNLWGKLSK